MTSVDPLAGLDRVDGHKRRTAQQLVVETLRRALISGELPYGVKLRQQAVAEQLGVSTTPVREAFQELAAEGFLRTDPYKGTYVFEPRPDELQDIYSLRTIVEAYGMRLAVDRITPEEIERAETLVDKIDVASDWAELVCLNRDFHKLLAEATHAPAVSQVLTTLVNVSVMYVAFSFRADPARILTSNHEHRELVDACRTKDVEKGVQTIQKHLQTTLELAESLFQNEHS